MFKSRLYLLILALSYLVIANASLAEPYVPDSNDTVIARWSVQDSPRAISSAVNSRANAIKTSQDLIERATQPGRSYLYSQAHGTLEPWINNDANDAQLWLTWARIQQQTHNFSSALKALETAITLEPKNVNAHLIMARTHVIQRNFPLAQKACAKVIFSGDLLSASICKLEVASFTSSLPESYSGLQSIALGLRENDPKRVWVNRILGDMAARQELWHQSETWLDAIYTENDVGILIDWADAKLKLKKYREVSDKLSAVVKRIPSSEDAILIRLALAEPHLDSKLTHSWKQDLVKRMTLREQRQDVYHANDLAVFYLDVQANAERALYWAEVNWQQAKEYKDQVLLERAKKVSRKAPNQPKANG